MKLVILGNGFDIAHNLKTSFSDFRKYLINIDKGELTRDIDEYISEYNPKYLKKDINMAWNDFESIIGNLFPKYRTNPAILEMLEDTIEYFVDEFYNYLKEITKSTITVMENIQSQITNADVILTFNYTDTYKHYNLNKNVDIFHIHGATSSETFPVIGYYVENVKKSNASDYSKRYGGNIIHKPAMAYKQNGIDLDSEIYKFVQKYSNKITEVVSIGYSYGVSDIHVYDILNSILVKQSTDNNVPTTTYDSLKKVDFKLFNYNSEETKNIQEKITSNFNSKYARKTSVKVFGNGIRKKNKDLIEFSYLNY